jgi:hypothetical protein
LGLTQPGGGSLLKLKETRHGDNINNSSTWEVECEMEASLHYIDCPKTKLNKQKKNPSWAQWLTPVILATEEAEMRRFALASQPCK